MADLPLNAPSLLRRPEHGVAGILQVSDHLGGVDGIYPEHDNTLSRRSFFGRLPRGPHGGADDVDTAHPEDAGRPGQVPWPVGERDPHAAPRLVGADEVD